MFSPEIHSILLCLFFALAGFFLGGVMFSVLIPRRFCGVDVRAESKDGNPGAGNAFMRCGVGVGILCLLLDLFKGFFPVFTAWRFLEDGWRTFLFSLVLVSPVLGHAVAPFFFLSRKQAHGKQPAGKLFRHGKVFRGGKGIATSFGVLLALLPFSRVVFLLALPYLLFTVLRFLPHRKRSILVYGIFGISSLPFLLYTDAFFLFPGCLGISVTVISRHLADHSAATEGVNDEKTLPEGSPSPAVESGRNRS